MKTREKILITGGAGFIGNAIIKQLYKEDRYDLVVLDCLSSQIHGENPEYSELYKEIRDKCTFIYGNVTDKNDCEKALNDIDYIIHLAAETGTGQSMYEVNHYNEVNVMGLSNILEIVLKRKLHLKKIVLSSSRAVYGEGRYLCSTDGIVYPDSRDVNKIIAKDFSVYCPICHEKVELLKTNESTKLKPISVYAYTKLAQEAMLKVVCSSMEIPYTIFRYQNVYGPGQSLKNPYTGILSIFSTLLLTNKTLNIFEDGRESRDFIYIDDVARGTICAINNDRANNECFNLGSGIGTTVIEIAEILKRYYQSASKIEITGDFRKGDIRHNIADISKAKKILDFIPEVCLEEGLKKFAEWVQKKDKKVFEESEASFVHSINEMSEIGMLIKGES